MTHCGALCCSVSCIVNVPIFACVLQCVAAMCCICCSCCVLSSCVLHLLCVAVIIFPDVPNFTFFGVCCGSTTCHKEQISRDADFDVCVAISYSVIDFWFFKTCQLSLFFFC